MPAKPRLRKGDFRRRPETRHIFDVPPDERRPRARRDPPESSVAGGGRFGCFRSLRTRWGGLTGGQHDPALSVVDRYPIEFAQKVLAQKAVDRCTVSAGDLVEVHRHHLPIAPHAVAELQGRLTPAAMGREPGSAVREARSLEPQALAQKL